MSREKLLLVTPSTIHALNKKQLSTLFCARFIHRSWILSIPLIRATLRSLTNNSQGETMKSSLTFVPVVPRQDEMKGGQR